MPNFFYIDSNGQKRGPANIQQLKTLAMRGIIVPNTPMESDSGHRGTAGQIPGLFDASPAPFAQSAPQAVTLFCTNCGNSVAEQSVACMSCGARPTGHRKFCRRCGVALNPEQIVCIKCGSSLVGNSLGASHSTDAVEIKTLNFYFMMFWIGVAVGFPIFVVSFGIASMVVGYGVPGRDSMILFVFALLAFVGAVVGIVGWVYGLILHYQLWKLIPADIARTTPGKAVGFLFIPFFNFYWIFVSYLGLGKDMNETLQQRGIRYQVNETLALVYGILVICGIIPYLGWLFSVAACIVCILFVKSAKDGAIALIERQ